MRPKKSLIVFDHRLLLTLLIIAGIGGLGWYYMSISKQIEQQESQITSWRNQERMLQETVNLQNEVIGLRFDVSRRIAIIKELTGDSDMRFAMMQYITKIIPNELWLNRISESMLGNRILFSIEGVSYDKRNISTFLANLEKYEPFEAVALESIRPAPMEITDAYLFSVRVEVLSKMPVEEPTLGSR
jgi:Tfp pilus assembly protein PilN